MQNQTDRTQREQARHELAATNEADRKVREQARREWAASAALRGEFVSEDSYVAFKSAEAAGRFKALSAQGGLYRDRA